MPKFRIRHTDGGEHEITATRAAEDGQVTFFESPSAGATSWKVVHQIPTAEIENVQRRVFESSGYARWITERPKRITASRTWS